ncbi:copper homeostasis protein CutC [Neomegalonema sp.]|uniref:copper homeostasis protein CutC n=1 Tax=Neomegalonema sp. TaxID=2039713 RepID=UPI0026193039|nr:copper homeostasis protein CutC [Neomegalonema sp.]MDD2869193.1 copper homeostasis protein CutC [Neomegalonema sp.]
MIPDGTPETEASDRIELEVCVDSAEGFATARQAGIDRIELCSALGLGGLTPSPGFLKAAASSFSFPDRPRIFVMIRPRPGDFVYGAADLAVAEADLAAARAAGAEGAVFGASRPDGGLDLAALERLKRAAGPLELTLHRAFDLTPDPMAALEQAVDLGFARILTSGGAATAPQGAALLARLIRAARGRIQIMPGGGVTPENARALLLKTGARALHGSFSGPARKGVLGEPGLRATSPQVLGRMLAALRRRETEEAAP